MIWLVVSHLSNANSTVTNKTGGAMFDNISLPQGWSRNRGLEARLVRPLCLEHESLSAFVDIAPPSCTEGPYECPADAVAVAKGYRSHDQFAGFACCVQRPIFGVADADHVVKEVMAELEAESDESAATRGY